MSADHRSAPGDGPLEQVLETEREGAAAVAAARRDASAWLENESAAIERATDAALAALDERHRLDLAAATREAQSSGAAIVTAAQSYARELESLTDHDLRPIVARQVKRILPGGAA
ncbi:MAG TPA: hypothetical protein VF491_03030 [Vicinamibacterales bacterium]|jgi:uncharacterized protein YgbK (DUF1537 family)